MTATLPPRSSTRFRGVIYGLDVIDHETGLKVPNDYVGKTRQRGRARENQHRDRQPFEDLIVGSSHALWEGMCTEGELDEWERHFIQDVEVRPRLNVELNEDNPHAIAKKVQVAQRHERDDRASPPRPRWVPFEQRRRESLLEWESKGTPSAPHWLPSTWSPRSQKFALWLVGWALLASLVWGHLARYAPFSAKVDGPAAAAAAAVLVLWAVLRTPDSWRLWAGRVRRARRAWRRARRSRR